VAQNDERAGQLSANTLSGGRAAYLPQGVPMVWSVDGDEAVVLVRAAWVVHPVARAPEMKGPPIGEVQPPSALDLAQPIGPRDGRPGSVPQQCSSLMPSDLIVLTAQRELPVDSSGQANALITHPPGQLPVS
jgi:hypothetical protein